MIQPLRDVHRGAATALAVLLPAILLIGLGARRPQEPSPSAPLLPASFELLAEDAAEWQIHAIHTGVYRDRESPDHRLLVLRPAQPVNGPDLLVYWSAMLPDQSRLPEGAHLLGEFGLDRALALPHDAQEDSHVILYSLAHQAVVDHAVLEKLP